MQMLCYDSPIYFFQFFIYHWTHLLTNNCKDKRTKVVNVTAQLILKCNQKILDPTTLRKHLKLEGGSSCHGSPNPPPQTEKENTLVILLCHPFLSFPLQKKTIHRIIEWPGLKRTIMIIEFQPPCYVQGHQPLEQAAQSHIQPGLECISGGASTTSLGNLFQCFSTL